MAIRQMPPQYIMGSDSNVNVSQFSQKTKNSAEREFNE